MAQAQITVNGVTGSNNDLPINTLVQLNNNNAGGETTFNWNIIDQPLGAVDSLSNAAIVNPTITPKKEGTYLIELVVNQGLGTEARNRVILGIRQLKSRERVPGAGEALEDGTRGWAGAAGSLLQHPDTVVGDNGTLDGIANVGLTRGQVVKLNTRGTLKSGLPGQEFLVQVDLAGNTFADRSGPLA